MNDLSMLQKMQRAAYYTFVRRYNNQPQRLALTSSNAILDLEQGTHFHAFSVNLPRPALGVKTLQLLKANLPLCTASFGDTETVFWYHRLRTQKNLDGATCYAELPSVHTLRCVRLLPTWYDPFLIANASNYGYNRSFESYGDLVSELNKACAHDLAYDNDLQHAMPFQPGDIQFSLTSQGRIAMTGNKVFQDFQAPAWNNASTYAPDFIVKQGDTFYQARVENKNAAPDASPVQWAVYVITLETICNTYLVAAYDDPSIALASSKHYRLDWVPTHIYNPTDVVWFEGRSWTSLTTNQGVAPPGLVWDAATLYYAGQVVYFANGIYRALERSQGASPASNPALWELQPRTDWALSVSQVEPTKLGVAGLSDLHDFEILRVTPQPCDRGARSLGLRLGFTWSDVYQLTQQLIYPEVVPTGSSKALVLNRLRPVPVYAEVDLLEDVPYPAYTATSISADAYCNLVRTDTVFLYSNIVGQSTGDNQRGNSLLAMITMNCGALGVAYSGDSIENPLQRVAGDIYSMGFQMYDQWGLPYSISNNAGLSLEFKLNFDDAIASINNGQ